MLNPVIDKMTALEAEIARLEDDLKAKKQELRVLQEVTIPELMEEIGISRCDLPDGRKLRLREVTRASPRASQRDRAMDWLEANGWAPMVKHRLTARFDRHQTEAAQAALAELEARGCAVECQRSVHPQTLNKLVREALESGQEFPDELFSIATTTRAEVK